MSVPLPCDIGRNLMARTVAQTWQPDPANLTVPAPPEVVALGEALEEHASGCLHCGLAMRDAIMLGLMTKLRQAAELGG